MESTQMGREYPGRIKKLSDNLQYLNEEEAALVGRVLQQKRGKGLVTEQLVAALNNLFKELELIELDPDNIRALFRGQVIDYYALNVAETNTNSGLLPAMIWMGAY